MVDFTFIHCADLHLGSRFIGIESVDGKLAEELRNSVFESFERIVDLALESGAEALMISGDVYDDGNASVSTRHWFSEQLSRLSIPVYICRGNHDSATKWDSSIPYPDNVHEFGSEVGRFDVKDGVEIVGASYSTQHETRNLASMMSGSSDKFTIACVHCDVDTASEGYAYAPCSNSDFVGKGVDYWALGHIHKSQVVSESPFAVYPGNIQGRSIKETGEKGAYLVTVKAGRVTEMRFVPTSRRNWKVLEVDISGKTLQDAIGYIDGNSGRDDICRIRFIGSGELDSMIRTDGEGFRRTISSSVGCVVESIESNTSPLVDLDARSGDDDMVGLVIRAGRGIESRGKDAIIDLICSNTNMRCYRSHFESLSEDELKVIVEDSIKAIVARLEAGA